MFDDEAGLNVWAPKSARRVSETETVLLLLRLPNGHHSFLCLIKEFFWGFFFYYYYFIVNTCVQCLFPLVMYDKMNERGTNNFVLKTQKRVKNVERKLKNIQSSHQDSVGLLHKS